MFKGLDNAHETQMLLKTVFGIQIPRSFFTKYLQLLRSILPFLSLQSIYDDSNILCLL